MSGPALEPNARNRFHVRARDQIKHIIETETYDLEKRMREGMRALSRDDFRSALRWFAEVRADPNHRNRDIQKIRLAVAKKNTRSRLLKPAKEHLIHDRSEKFIEIRDVFKLLTIWLPEGHKDRKEARKHGLGRRIEGGFAAGQTVALVEDTCTTGGSTLEAVDLPVLSAPM